jgi:hypothetical protein
VSGFLLRASALDAGAFTEIIEPEVLDRIEMWESRRPTRCGEKVRADRRRVIPIPDFTIGLVKTRHPSLYP